MNLKTEIKQKIKTKYILRRVGFLVISFLLIILLLVTIILNRPPETINAPIQRTPENTESIVVLKPITTPVVQKKKTILIYHTHNDEAYYKGSKKYVESDIGRSFDENYNIISVGQALKMNLESNNFKVIHDKSDNVSEGFNSAYDTSFKNIEKYVGNVDIFIDLHRDAYSQTEKNYIKSNSKEYAHIRMVVANGTNYKIKPNYNENLKFAKELDEKLNSILPGISKGIFLKDARLNQHVSDFCLLIEIGNEKNDIEQAINSTEIIATALNDIFY